MMIIIMMVMPKGTQKYLAESMTSPTSTTFLLSDIPGLMREGPRISLYFPTATVQRPVAVRPAKTGLHVILDLGGGVHRRMAATPGNGSQAESQRDQGREKRGEAQDAAAAPSSSAATTSARAGVRHGHLEGRRSLNRGAARRIRKRDGERLAALVLRVVDDRDGEALFRRFPV